jgi:demethylmenaquinone methyltransferase/2-methoxy-6-polyprenyl-1,4-benzoquinol methylase
MVQHTVARNGRAISKMFDRIAPRYDLLNRVLSFGRDVTWRSEVSRHLPKGDNIQILDLATGTGDLALSLIAKNKNVVGVIGLDMAKNMVEIGRAKIDKAGHGPCVQLQVGDASDIAFPDDIFDAVTIAFGIRNVAHYERAIGEMHRVLKKGGRVIVLEFSLPTNAFVRALYLLYFRHVLPLVGGLISGDRSAYRYLNQTAETFVQGEAFLALLKKSGFQNCRMHQLTFGVASIYVGDKGA